VAANTSGKLEQLKEILAEVTDLGRAAAVLEWDQETYMPPGGVESRAEQQSTLQRLAHVRFASREVGKLLDSLEKEVAGRPYDSYEASLVRVTRRDYQQQVKIPADLVADIARAGATARPYWEKARSDNQFSLFAPYLETNVELNRRLADALGYDKRPYDALIDLFEPDLTTSQLEAIFDELKMAIVPLVSDIARNSDAVDDGFLHSSFEPGLQVKYGMGAVVKLGYDLERGRQDLSAHPFMTTFGPGDTRITTRIDPDFFNMCFFGLVHESGHAMYQQGISEEIDRTPLWDGASPGVHESQSRLWENIVGRSQPFWRHFFPSLRSTFPEQLRGVDEEAFYRAVNKSHPSLIRIEADEVTYNLHILLRFELENELLEGKLRVKDLPEAWKERVQSYLGIDVPDDRDGVLQDIHWSGVSFGIFPGYTLGNLIGAQLMEKVRIDIPDLDSRIEAGEFASLLGWLRKNVHESGRKFTPNELVERATGRPLTPAPWVAYVQKKFGALYNLEPASR
jgi:carboxypeptidase Taq